MELGRRQVAYRAYRAGGDDGDEPDTRQACGLDTVCFRCGGRGHMQEDCPSPAAVKQRRQQNIPGGRQGRQGRQGRPNKNNKGPQLYKKAEYKEDTSEAGPSEEGYKTGSSSEDENQTNHRSSRSTVRFGKAIL